MIVADLPFMANATTEQTLNNSALLMQAGAHDQARGHRLAGRVDPPAGRPRHPGVRAYGADPQAVNLFGGYKVQGREEAQAQQMLEDAKSLEAAGAAMLLLECVPSELAARITRAVQIPVIGIGAGSDRRPVLVLHDMLDCRSAAACRSS